MAYRYIGELQLHLLSLNTLNNELGALGRTLAYINRYQDCSRATE